MPAGQRYYHATIIICPLMSRSHISVENQILPGFIIAPINGCVVSTVSQLTCHIVVVVAHVQCQYIRVKISNFLHQLKVLANEEIFS